MTREHVEGVRRKEELLENLRGQEEDCGDFEGWRREGRNWCNGKGEKLTAASADDDDDDGGGGDASGGGTGVR